MPRRRPLVKSSESTKVRITIPAKEEASQPERSDVSRESDQALYLQLIARWSAVGVRSVGRINPRLAVAVVSCALFAGLLVRVSHVAQHRMSAPTSLVATAGPPRESDETKQALETTPVPTVAAVRMIDAPSAISSSCREQAWPYVTGDCLTQGDEQIQTEAVAPDANPNTDAADHVVPAVFMNAADAQAKMSPEDSLSVIIDKPRRAHSASKRRNRQVRADRKRRAAPRAIASRDVASGMPAFTPLEASNMP